MSTGYMQLFRFRGMPIRMHWSVLVLVAYVLGENNYALAGLLGFLVIILVHELGHALLVRKYRLHVHEIHIHPFGGECIHEAPGSARKGSIIAWGGVLAQLALCAAAFAVLTLAAPSNPYALVFLDRLLVPNLIMAAFNLLPIPPLDGARAWRLFARPRRPLRVRVAMQVAPAPARTPATKATGSANPRVLTSAEQAQLGALVDDALEQAKAKGNERKPS